MTSSPVTCSQCGAEVHTATAQNGFVHCEYCGASVPVNNFSPQKNQPVQSNPSTMNDSNLPLEYARLERPKPSPSLESSGCSVVLGLIWTIFSSVFVVVGVVFFSNEYIEYNRLTKEGISTTAIITGLNVDDSGDSTSYLVYYQFRAPVNGGLTRFENNESVSSGFYSSLWVEQKIEILYAASDPSISVIKSEFDSPSVIFPLVFSGLGGLFVLIGLGLLYGSIRAQYHLRLLRSEGHQTMGFIIDRWRDKDSEGTTIYFIAYAFKELGGQIISRAEQNHTLYQKYKIGDTISIRYLPYNPSICSRTSL